MTSIISEAVKATAQAYTYQGKVLNFINPNFPLAVFADGYLTETEATEQPVSQALVTSVESHFETDNSNVPESVEDEREAIIANTRAGIAHLQYNTHNVLIPAIKAMCNSYTELQTTVLQPDIEVETFTVSRLYQDSDLTNHLESSYSRYQTQREYRTFMLEASDAPAIIDLVTHNNPHITREAGFEWALAIGAEKTVGVWNALFSGGRNLSLSQLPFLRLGNAPFNLDEITLAYFILGALRNTPQDIVVGESVSLEDWNSVMSELHSALGRSLLGALQQRAEARDAGTLVLRSSVTNIEGRAGNKRIRVILNGDVATEWLANNTVEAILGAAVSNPNLVTTAQLSAEKEKLVAVWNNTYPLLKQATLDYANLSRRESVIKAFTTHVDLLAPMFDVTLDDGLQERISVAIRQLDHKLLDNHFMMFTELACKVTDSDNIFRQYLEAIDEYSNTFPNATDRELETQAMITVVAVYLAAQINVATYKPEIDETAAEEPEAEVLETDEDADVELEEASEVEADTAEVEDIAETEEETKTNESKSAMSELDDLDADTELE